MSVLTVSGLVNLYLAIAEDRAEGSSQMGPQGQSVHNEVLLSGGQLKKAGEALEGSVVVMLQVNCNLLGHRQVLHHGVQSCLSLYEGQRRVFQCLQKSRCYAIN